MLSTIGYVMAYALIGILTGLASKRLIPGRVGAGPRQLVLIGIISAVVSGLAGLAVLSYGWSKSQSEGTGGEYANQSYGMSGLPDYWISLFAATLGALLVLAVYKLMAGNRRTV
jgi:uncharacterized membrane protein YeaQ/YmgE (transglycosylase-associated protein family)